jgi:hypothetical protein
MTNIEVQIMNQHQDVMDSEEFNEYIALCEKHGITARDTVPSGYWEPDAYERRVIGTIFSRVIELTAYKESIPLRVLTELDKVKKDDKYYYILTPESDPDPFLVESDYQYSWGVLTRPFTVIARWGTHLPDMPEMEKRAVELTKVKLFEYVQKLQTALHHVNSDLDAQARAVLYGNEPQSITF